MPKNETIAAVSVLAEKVGTVLVATADATGLPHVAAAGRLAASAQGGVAVTAWFCPGTLRNLQSNRRIALVVWDRQADTGYQVLARWRPSAIGAC